MWEWRKKSRAAIAESRADIHEARVLRGDAERSLRQAEQRAPVVSRLASEIAARREVDPFGQALRHTFVPRKG